MSNSADNKYRQQGQTAPKPNAAPPPSSQGGFTPPSAPSDGPTMDMGGDGWSSQSGVDYADPRQNYGVHGTDQASWNGKLYLGISKSWEHLPYSTTDYALLNRAPATNRLKTGVFSGFNTYDQNGQPDFNEWSAPQDQSFGADAYLFYSGADKNRRAYLQGMLWEAGLIDRKNPVPEGDWGSYLDEDYNKAWRQAVEAAQATGIPLFVLLQQEAAAIEASGGLGKSRGSGSGSGGGPTRPTVQIISEDDARVIVDQVTKEQLGRKLTDEEAALANGIIAAIRGRMEREQNAVIDQQMAGGGTVSQQTDPRTTAKLEVESRMENESTAYDLAEAFASLVGLSGGGS